MIFIVFGIITIIFVLFLIAMAVIEYKKKAILIFCCYSLTHSSQNSVGLDIEAMGNTTNHCTVIEMVWRRWHTLWYRERTVNKRLNQCLLRCFFRVISLTFNTFPIVFVIIFGVFFLLIFGLSRQSFSQTFSFINKA